MKCLRLAWCLLVVTAIAVTACGEKDVPSEGATGGALGTGGDTSSGGVTDPTAPGQREFESIRDGFEALETLAGSGLAGGDTNDWDASFEGASALDVDLSTPHNALGDAEGNTYIADKDAHAIRKITPDGVLSTVAGMNEAGDDGDLPALGVESHLTQPNGLWVKPDGTVYILDLGNRKIRRLDPDGTLTTLFTAPTLETGRGLWLADDESLAYVCSGSEVLRWTPDTGVKVHASGFSELGNLFVDRDELLFVTDRGKNQIFNLGAGEGIIPAAIAGNGTVSGTIDRQLALEAPLAGVRGIWGSSTGGFFLATHEGNQVLYEDSTGYMHVFIDGAHDAHAGDGEALSTPGAKVSEVRNVTMNPAGDLLITENDLGFIRIARKKR